MTDDTEPEANIFDQIHSELSGKPASNKPQLVLNKVAYECFVSQDKTFDVLVKCYATGAGQLIPYQELKLAHVDIVNYTFLSFHTSLCRIRFYGENLQSLVKAIRLRTAETITEYSELHHLPPAKGQPIIHRMNVEVVGEAPPLGT